MTSEVATADEPAPPSVGARRIAHYEIEARLGEGGMGVVYRALDTKLRRAVALKVLHPNVAEDEDRRRRFVREGRLVAHLTHPNIATVYDVGEADGRVYIAMELVEGEPLTAMIKPGRHVSVPEALRIVHEVARGLSKAHEIGVIHRDLKPDNIMVGDDGIVKILDFGVAKRLDSFKIDFTDIKTQHGSLVGTPAYMSPEQAAGKKEVDQRSDLFSVGVVLFELLTGKRPFDGDTWQETIIAINRDEPPPVSSLRSDAPSGLDDMIDACLAKDPDSRYASCRELVEDIESVLLALSTGTFPPGASGLIARASMTSSAPPPVSGDDLGVLRDPTTLERTAEPVARSMTGSELTMGQRRGPLLGGLLLAVLIAGVVAYAATGDEPEPATDTRGEVGAPDEQTAQAPPEDEPAGQEDAEPEAEPPAGDGERAGDGESRAADEATAEPTAEPAPPPAPVAAPRPAPAKPPPKGPAAPKAPPPSKPKNPVLGF